MLNLKQTIYIIEKHDNMDEISIKSRQTCFITNMMRA